MSLGAKGSSVKTEAITFRLSKDLVDLLRKEAAYEKVNTSALMNKVMAAYFDFYKLADSTSMITVPKKTLMMLLDDVPQERIAKLVSVTESEFVNLFYMKEDHHDSDAILREFLSWIDKSSISTKEIFEDDERVVVVNHGMGERMTSLLSAMLTRCFAKAGGRMAVASENGLMIIRIKQKQEASVPKAMR